MALISDLLPAEFPPAGAQEGKVNGRAHTAVALPKGRSDERLKRQELPTLVSFH